MKVSCLFRRANPIFVPFSTVKQPWVFEHYLQQEVDILGQRSDGWENG
jgi:hypothetical protein